MSETTSHGTCGLCGHRVEVGEILEHLRVVHGHDVEIAEWPDGETVIVDLTLEPDDFGAGSEQ